VLGGCAERWPKLAWVVIVESEREVAGKRTRATRCSITSLAEEASEMSRIVRGHWGIENRLHWVLDVAFGDKRARVRESSGCGQRPRPYPGRSDTLLAKETRAREASRRRAFAPAETVAIFSYSSVWNIEFVYSV
jgi:hypothetical protein